jgi:hypothetical protein
MKSRDSVMAVQKVPNKLQLVGLGEVYNDLLMIDSWMNNDSPTSQARSLLRSKLMQREAMIKERVAYLAKKRGTDPDILWLQILKGEAEPIDASEIVINEAEND